MNFVPRIFFRSILICIAAAITSASAYAQINAIYTDESVRLDGVLNEPVWKSASVIDDFTQRELTEGAEPTEKTEVRVIFDDNNLYIGAVFFDSEPDKIIRKELKRDGDTDSDDSFTVVIDTYHDKRMGFYFSVNPNSARLDGTCIGGSNTVNTNWDGIWDVSSVITDKGWSCEIVIPFKTLRFPNTSSQTWGINFRRRIRRKNEEVLWRAWGLNDGINQLSKAGTLSIEHPLRNSRQLDFIPFLLGGTEKEEDKDSNDTFRYGLDVKYGITTNTTLDLTFKTDFAQIESDREVINLTRFDITYPEKRDFFLEGADLFNFTQGGTRLFYSRRIGISPDRQEVPILAGAKLMQKTGTFRLGIINMQTEAKHGVPGTNYTVARMRKDVLDQSYVGAIVTNLIDADGHDNQAISVDFGYQTDKFLSNKNLNIQGYLAGTVTDGKADDTLAGRVYLNYSNDLISTYMLYHQINPNFSPEVGFVRRTGLKNSIWNLKYTPRVNIPHVKKILTQPVYINYTTDMNDKLISRTMEFRPFGIETESGDIFTANYRNSYDYVEEDFTLFKDTDVKQGVYDWWFYMLVLHSSTTRKVSGLIVTKWGDYYDGTQSDIHSSLTLKTTRHIAVSADAGVKTLSLGTDEFTTRDYGARMVLDFSTDLNATTFVQYNNFTEKVNVNFRIHWIPKVGSDLYIVYNHMLDEHYEIEDNRFDTIQQAGMLKLDYTYRF
ncbi:MAG TPA: hypothetical protein ENH82_01445 [bacterium]|nr:hypothetical protein [bacterium]